jgi:phosphomannomutase
LTSNPDKVIQKLTEKLSDQSINTDDGLRVDFEEHWVHFRKSNTEPIIRIITEAKTKIEAESLSEKYLGIINGLEK